MNTQTQHMAAGLLESIDRSTQLAGYNRLALLLFRIGERQIFGINVFKVQEVLQAPPLTRLPSAHPLISGVAEVRGAVIQMGTQKIDRAQWDWDAVSDNPFWCPDRQAAQTWEGYLDDVRKRGSSCGAVIEVVASGVPVGLGEPVYDKLDAELAKALMSINAVKGVEIGDGFATASMSGEENADEMRMEDGKPAFLSNHAGGILGGISSGQDIVCRLAIKPTSSILAEVRSVDRFGNEVELRTKGRHDPCVGLRGTPVAEAMVACVLADHLLRHRAQCG